jgi:hypothetical protein
MAETTSPGTVCLGVFMNGDEFDIVCVGSLSQCKAAIRDYGRAHAHQYRNRHEEARVARKQQRHGRVEVPGSFEVQEWPLGGIDPHWTQKKSVMGDHPYTVAWTANGEGKGEEIPRQTKKQRKAERKAKLVHFMDLVKD